MIQEEIESTLPSGKRLPEPIAKICTFLDENDYPISGCFELSKIGMDDMNYWFRNNLHAVQELIPFGRGACGDVYCLWLTQGLSTDEAPVVMFGSEGELSVLAKNAKEFCKLLCLGYSEIGLEDHTVPGDEYEETEEFRNYMLKTYNFNLPETGALIIKQANEAFPDFIEWERKYAN